TKWRKVFASHAPAHRQAGLRLEHLWRRVENSNKKSKCLRSTIWRKRELSSRRQTQKMREKPQALSRANIISSRTAKATDQFGHFNQLAIERVQSVSKIMGHNSCTASQRQNLPHLQVCRLTAIYAGSAYQTQTTQNQVP